MKLLEAAIKIAATPERVWAVLTDLEKYTEWNPFIKNAKGEVKVLANLMHSYAGAHWIKEWHQREGEPVLQTLQDLQDLLFPRRPAGT